MFRSDITLPSAIFYVMLITISVAFLVYGMGCEPVMAAGCSAFVALTGNLKSAP